MENKEVWRPVVGYEGYYEVSNYGRVKSLCRVILKNNGRKQTCKERIMAVHQRKDDGRVDIILCGKDGTHKRHKVHRIVAKAFIPNPDNLPEINHKDENPANNAVWNLEWCDRWYNTHYGEYSVKIGKAEKKPVLQIKDGDVTKKWDSILDASIFFKGKKTGAIYMAVAGKCKTAYGYIWRYA